MKKIWILNHYATDMYEEKEGRHFSFAKYLLESEYKPTIFCANTFHNKESLIKINKGLNKIKEVNNIPFVFIRTNKYEGNGIRRIANMICFYFNLRKTLKERIKKEGCPDIILASSAHILTLVAGIKASEKYCIPIICEIRDLWPESIVTYTKLTKKHFIIKLLYTLEKWIYKKADKLVFTMEGGKDYIIEQKWATRQGGSVNLNKVFHVNNGVDYETFIYNKKHNQIKDKDLENNKFKVIYTGSIRVADNLIKLVDTAHEIEKLDKDIIFLVYGQGVEKENLEKYVKELSIENIKFKGSVCKKNIPYILSKADLNIFHFQQNQLKKYGPSLNKMFDYFASGKPTITDSEFGYDIIKKYNAGVVIDNATSKEWAKAIVNIKNMDIDKYNKLCKNAIVAAKDYDFKNLTKKLIDIIEN